MNIKTAPLGEYGANFYLITDDTTKEAFAVDPGAQGEIASELIDNCGCALKYIIITHAHADHIGALDYIKEKYNAKTVIHKDDADALANGVWNLCDNFGISSPVTSADILVNDGDTLPFGGKTIKFIHTPGHTRGSMCILTDEFLLSGDTLFQASIGRCDFPGGSYDKIISSIKSKILTLNDDLKIYPGHGNPTTVEYEKNNNPFLNI